MSKIVKVEYDATKPETKITADGKEFDTSRIKGKEIEDWAYPFMVRKVTWDGFYDETEKSSLTLYSAVRRKPWRNLKKPSEMLPLQ